MGNIRTEITKRKRKLEKIERKIRKIKPFIDFEIRYSKEGLLSDRVRDLEELKNKEIMLKNEIMSIENR